MRVNSGSNYSKKVTNKRNFDLKVSVIAQVTLGLSIFPLLHDNKKVPGNSYFPEIVYKNLNWCTNIQMWHTYTMV